MGDPFFRTCRFGVMTYVLMHALTSVTAFVLTTFTDIYEEGQNPPRSMSDSGMSDSSMSDYSISDCSTGDHQRV